jgi:hypothetical protein
VQAEHGWSGVAQAFEAAYTAARDGALSGSGTAD